MAYSRLIHLLILAALSLRVSARLSKYLICVGSKRCGTHGRSVVVHSGKQNQTVCKELCVYLPLKNSSLTCGGSTARATAPARAPAYTIFLDQAGVPSSSQVYFTNAKASLRATLSLSPVHPFLISVPVPVARILRLSMICTFALVWNPSMALVTSWDPPVRSMCGRPTYFPSLAR